MKRQHLALRSPGIIFAQGFIFAHWERRKNNERGRDKRSKTGESTTPVCFLHGIHQPWGLVASVGSFPKSPLHLLTAYPIGIQMVLALAHHPIVCDECICIYSDAISQAPVSVLL